MSSCEECNNETWFGWCKACNTKHFQRDFRSWTSGNADIDKFIQHNQLSANCHNEVLEWIPYNKFRNIECIAKGGFCKVYKANWIDGFIVKWSKVDKNWERLNSDSIVALKSLNNSTNFMLESFSELISHHKIISDFLSSTAFRLYGITQDPETKDYVLVLDYADQGSLRNYLDANYDKLGWYEKIHDLWTIAVGLDEIHREGLIHQNLHIGNLLKFSNGGIKIVDIGLCKPIDYNKIGNNGIYGVLPYVAPEVLRGQNYTKAADIYSFGIIMYEVISGLPPYHDVSHDKPLAMKICLGLRPRFNIKVPRLVVDLIKRCLDANPLNRPTANEISNQLRPWIFGFDNQKELKKQIEETENFNNNLSTNNNKTHPEAIYTSRLLNFNNLPEQKNSDDYYDEQNDNIISKKFSESLKIDISYLKLME